ncbi:hypothetical protein R6Z07M_018977 [Ovis aries]
MWDLSSLSRDRACAPCTGSSLNHWTATEIPHLSSLITNAFNSGHFPLHTRSLWSYLRVCLFISWLPWWLSSRESIFQGRRFKRHGFDPWIRKILWKRKWQPTPVFLLGKSHGQRSLVGYSPWGCKRVGHDLVNKQ